MSVQMFILFCWLLRYRILAGHTFSLHSNLRWYLWPNVSHAYVCADVNTFLISGCCDTGYFLVTPFHYTVVLGGICPRHTGVRGNDQADRLG